MTERDREEKMRRWERGRGAEGERRREGEEKGKGERGEEMREEKRERRIGEESGG